MRSPHSPSTQFAFSLFEALKPGGSQPGHFSYSARVVLAMLWEGSTGETRKAMVETLRLDEDPIASPTLTSAWGGRWAFNWRRRPAAPRPGDARRQLPVGATHGFVSKQDFVKTLKEHYWAEVQTLDCRAPDSARKVNAWANEKTRGAHTAVVDSLEPFSPLVTMNAVYSKDYGRSPSRSTRQRRKQFTLQDGANQLVPMMRQWGNFRYAERGGAQIVSLPYKGGMSMRVVLPPKQIAFPKVLRGADQHRRHKLDRRAMGERDGHIRLPRFRIETQADLGGPLKAMECRKSSTQRARHSRASAIASLSI